MQNPLSAYLFSRINNDTGPSGIKLFFNLETKNTSSTTSSGEAEAAFGDGSADNGLKRFKGGELGGGVVARLTFFLF